MAQGRKNKKRDRKRLPFVRPPHLDAAQAAEWDRIVAAQAADWFVSGAEILLECYVVSVCYMRALHKKRAEMLVDPDNTPSSLIGISESIAAEARNLIALARQLRLSQQSRVRADGAKERPVMPWEDTDDEEEGTG